MPPCPEWEPLVTYRVGADLNAEERPHPDDRVRAQQSNRVRSSTNMNDTALTFLAPSFEWTDDCQGKKDYDGRLLSVSTRYWPPNYDRERQHTASASILWGDPATDYIEIARREFSAGTLDDVKSLVEAWVLEQSREMFDRLTGRGVEWGGKP